MGNLNALIREETISFPSKTHKKTARSIGSSAVRIVEIRKIYTTKREILILLLESQRAKKEAEIVTRVERNLKFITNSLKTFFQAYKANVTSYSADVVNRKKTLDNNAIIQYVLPTVQLQQLEMEMKNEIQQEINLVFGVKSLKIAAIKSNVDELVHHQHEQNIDRLLSEYRKAIFVAQHMTTVANKVWDQCLDTFDLPPIVNKVVKKFKIGSLFMNTVNCRPSHQLGCCRREIEKYLTGILINVENEINQDMRKTTAKVFYELYDQTIASDFENQLAVLMTQSHQQVVKKRRKSSLYLLKQADVSL